MAQALYNKWRPRTWEEVVGQAHVIQTLRNAIAAGRIAHAYLFAGPRGTGKTTTARILAKAVNCLDESPAARPCNRCSACLAVNEGRFLDLIEIDAASNTSVEDVRDLRERVPLAPNQGRYKVYIIDEVHMLSTAAFNALLKTLEEPPAHAIFILATTEVHKLPATVLSRCQRHEFRRLGVAEIVPHLQEVAKEEGLTADVDALEAIARQSTGSVRDALSLLDQMASLQKPITLEGVLAVLGAVPTRTTEELVRALVAGEAARGLMAIHETIDAGADPRQFARQVVDYLRGLLLARMGNLGLVEATADTKQTMQGLSATIDLDRLLDAIRAFNVAASESRSGWRPQLPLELAFLEALGSGSNDDRSGGESPRGPVVAHPVPSAGAPPSAASKGGKVVGTASADPRAVASRLSEPAGDELSATPGGSLTLRKVGECWPQVLASMRRRDMRGYTLLAQARLYSLEGEVLSLAFESELPRAKASRSETVAGIQGALAEVLGHPLLIRCVLARAQSSNKASTVVEGGMVDVATRELGAQAIDLP